jgi:hypothetical protein
MGKHVAYFLVSRKKDFFSIKVSKGKNLTMVMACNLQLSTVLSRPNSWACPNKILFK